MNPSLERDKVYILYNLIYREGHVRSRGSGCWIVTMKFTILQYSRSMNYLNYIHNSLLNFLVNHDIIQRLQCVYICPKSSILCDYLCNANPRYWQRQYVANMLYKDKHGMLPYISTYALYTFVCQEYIKNHLHFLNC